MADVRFKIDTQAGKIANPVLTDAQYRELGELMVANQKARWARAMNTRDMAARPLNRITAKGKMTYRGTSKRDNVMTGLMRSNFTLRRADQFGLRAENTSVEGRRHARQAQWFERMIGISPSERDALFQHAYRAYGAYLRGAWRPDRA